jgi:N-methylhydantoinase A
MRVGIDVGGTFTDLVLVDDRTGEIFYTKVDTTPRDLAEGVLAGLQKIQSMSGRKIRQVETVIHGTTIGTNALIERKGAPTGLLTTEGFIDVLEIGRFQRPAEGLYDFTVDNPPPLIPRHLRKPVRERVDARGEVVVPLDESSARSAIAALKKERVESIAVTFLFSFANPAHEKRVAELIREMAPGVTVSLSSEIAPEFREYERTSTTAINAYLLPILSRYIEKLSAGIQKKYGIRDLRIMVASGGSIAAEVAKHHAVHTVNSGPAGGALAGTFIGKKLGRKKIITVDMGGTSFDIHLTELGEPQVRSDGKFEELPVRIPIIDINAIGAGGGSIAWIDRGGALNVGPQSAGAEPGPACYGRGGGEPTVTDANLVLGRINPDYFLGGEMKLDTERARQVVLERIGKPLNMTAEDAAWGILRLVNANMVKGISVKSIERGYDIREFSLIAFGGAGPLHAADIALELGLREVIVPPIAGDFSAVGLLVGDTRHDYVRTIMKEKHELTPAALQKAFIELERRGIEALEKQKVRDRDLCIQWSCDLRFKGQSYEINTPVKRKMPLTAADIEKISRDFNRIHKRIYAYGSMDEAIEFVNVRVTAIGKSPGVKLRKIPTRRGGPESARKGKRKVYFNGRFINAPVYEREHLRARDRIRGPAVIEEALSSTVLPPRTQAIVREEGTILIRLRG